MFFAPDKAAAVRLFASSLVEKRRYLNRRGGGVGGAGGRGEATGRGIRRRRSR